MLFATFSSCFDTLVDVNITVSGKRDQNVFCNIFNKTQAMKFETLYPE